MPLILALDQGIPRDAASRLRDLGYECTHVGDVGMSAADDHEIPEFALGKNAVVVTLDAGFHAILAVSGAAGIRIQGLRAMEIAEGVRLVCARFGGELSSLVTVKPRKTTCHRLPIGHSR
jgi:predicted nuclease of predicted toxin-antitoxin system